LSARWITEVGTRSSEAASGRPSRSRATATSRFSSPRSNKNPRSHPVTESAASTTAVRTSCVESEFCNARATSTKLRSLARLFSPEPGAPVEEENCSRMRLISPDSRAKVIW
jgi:hypothetical protein